MMPKTLQHFLAFIGFLMIQVEVSSAAELNVVATIRPLHSITSAVMEGVGEPKLLMSENSSPHGQSLKPSQVRTLHGANIVIWFGPELESGLTKVIARLQSPNHIVRLKDAPGLQFRHHKEGENRHEDHSSHEHETVDPHLWLDPVQASVMAQYIAEMLGKIDNANSEKYTSNAKEFDKKTKHLLASIKMSLAPVVSSPFLTLHDGLHYFEKRFNLNGKGAVLNHQDRKPSAKHIRELQQRVTDLQIKCFFVEPQQPQNLMKLVAESTTIEPDEIDIIGSSNVPGPSLYFDMMGTLAKTVRRCLSK